MQALVRKTVGQRVLAATWVHAGMDCRLLSSGNAAMKAAEVSMVEDAGYQSEEPRWLRELGIVRNDWT